MNDISRNVRRPVAVVLAALVLATVPGVALAQTGGDAAPTDRVPSGRAVTDRTVTDDSGRDRDFESVKARLLEAIEKRLEALDRLSETVASNEHVSANHAAHLQKDYKDAEKILEKAAEDVADAETFEDLRAVVPEVFTETLVFALLKPKTGLVLASGGMVAVYERMGEFGSMLQGIIDRLAERGLDMGEAQAALDEMVRLLGAAEEIAEPVADHVVDLDQKDWPDPAKGVMEQAKADLEAGRELLRQARGQAQATVQAIREALGG